jgi:ribonuclease P protein component
MFNKKQRLSRAEFDRFFAIGKRLHSPSLTLIYAKSEGSHASVVVGKKVAKKAVDRNTLRRRIYGLLYEHLKTQNAPYTLIAIAKPNFIRISRKEASEETKALLTKLP